MLLAVKRLADLADKRWPVKGVIPLSKAGVEFKLYNECDDGLVSDFFYSRQYDEDADLILFTALAYHSKTIIDIGANTGLFSVLSSVANKSAAIYAVEPYTPNFTRLNINLQLNNCSNVKPMQVAIGESVGSIEMTVPENNSITDVSSVNGDFSKKIYPDMVWKKQTVKLETLDNIKQTNKLTIDLIKCDVESYEMSVFKGMDQVLQQDRPAILFECFVDEERQKFFNEILTKYNYYIYGVLSEGLVHLNNGLQNMSSLNYLFSPVVPKDSFVTFEQIKLNPESILLRPTAGRKT
jgi:FkbM family methyltransferase